MRILVTGGAGYVGSASVEAAGVSSDSKSEGVEEAFFLPIGYSGSEVGLLYTPVRDAALSAGEIAGSSFDLTCRANRVKK